jgi:hypothetical protein
MAHAFRCKVILALCLLAAAKAGGAVIDPGEQIAGRSQAEWSAEWWKWALSFPEAASPQVDPTGALSHLGDRGPVFFLAGSFQPGSLTRTATVREDQYLFFPLINVVSWEAISAYGGGEANLRRDAAETIGITPAGDAPGNTLFAELDGVDLALPPPATSLFDFRQTSPGLFDITLPPGAVFGFPAGTVSAVSDGWWLALSPLAPGNYVLRTGGSFTGLGPYSGSSFSLDTTWNLTVAAVPEPSTMLLVIGGLCAVFGRRLLKRS